MKQVNVGILGATGAVGQEMIKILEERNFPVASLRPIASARSAGSKIMFRGQECTIVEASDDAFEGLDIVLGAAENDQSGGVGGGNRVSGRILRGERSGVNGRARGDLAFVAVMNRTDVQFSGVPWFSESGHVCYSPFFCFRYSASAFSIPALRRQSIATRSTAESAVESDLRAGAGTRASGTLREVWSR